MREISTESELFDISYDDDIVLTDDIHISTNLFHILNKYFDSTSSLVKFGYSAMGDQATGSFNGTFDGNGYTIHNLVQPLFKNIKEDGVVKNVNIKNSFSSTCVVSDRNHGVIKNVNVFESFIQKCEDSLNHDFGILTSSNKGTIRSCLVSNSDISFPNGQRVGGIAGRSSGSIHNCVVTNTEIQGQDFVGGIVGESITPEQEGVIVNCETEGCVISGIDKVGGICGDSFDTTITECSNNSSVKGEENIGGICGYMSFGGVSFCENSGVIYGGNKIGGINGFARCDEFRHSTNMGLVKGEEAVGGVVGKNSDSMFKCVNEGTVKGISLVGGVVGRNFGEISCVKNKSTVLGEEEVGGLIGVLEHSTITESSNTGLVESNKEYGGLVGVIADSKIDLSKVMNCYNVPELSNPIFGKVLDSAAVIESVFWLNGSHSTDKYGKYADMDIEEIEGLLTISDQNL